jgi:Cu+-exporting ATPase
VLSNLALMQTQASHSMVWRLSRRLQRGQDRHGWLLRQASGVIAVADTIKDGSVEAVRRLRDLGITVVMMTGDNQGTADAIAAKRAGPSLLGEPGDKAAYIKQGGRRLCSQDGERRINDAPA